MKAYCLNLSPTDEDLLEIFFQDKKKEVDIVTAHSFAELQKKALNEKGVISFFCCIDEKVSLDALEEFLSKYVNDNIHIILKEQNFEQLFLCHRYNVLYVFENRLDKASLEAAFMKAEFYTNTPEVLDMPLNVTSLFARAIKIKTPQELFFSLNRYLSSIKSVKKFSYLIECLGDIKNLGEKLDPKLQEKILEQEWSKKYIRDMKTLEKGQTAKVIIATWIHEDGKELLYLEIENEALGKVLNSFFFNYLESVLIYRNNKIKETKLQELVNLDEVTGVFNSRKLMEDLKFQIYKHKLKQEKFCVLFIDIDHFKQVNDSYGHLAGSKLLVELADFLKKQLREGDSVYRYGGDEFVVIMPYLGTSVVSNIAERVLKNIKDYVFSISKDEKYRMSVSIGISEYPTDALSEKEIIKFADEMMYKSKKSGRGKVFYLNKE